MIKRLLPFILALMLLMPCASAQSVSGLTYDDFTRLYADNLDFINDNAGRHLLPLIPANRDAEWHDGREYYEIYGDVLTLSIRTDPSGEIIETCVITLTAPANMSYGSSVHRDFTTSGYQSYGMLMAMAAGETAYDRYQLVTDVEEGLKNGGGVYHRQIGVYQLEAVSQNGAVTMTFTNATAAPTPSPEPTPSPTPDPNAEPTPEPELAG